MAPHSPLNDFASAMPSFLLFLADATYDPAAGLCVTVLSDYNTVLPGNWYADSFPTWNLCLNDANSDHVILEHTLSPHPHSSHHIYPTLFSFQSIHYLLTYLFLNYGHFFCCLSPPTRVKLQDGWDVSLFTDMSQMPRSVPGIEQPFFRFLDLKLHAAS